MPECHSGRPGSTPGGRTTTCRSGDQRCLQNGACAVRFRGASPGTSRWLGGPPSKRTREGSNPSWCTTPRSTSGEVIGLSSRSDGLDTHTRCPVSADGSAASLRTRLAVVRLHPETLPGSRQRICGDAPNVARRSSTLRERTSEHGAMVAHYSHTVGIGRFEYGARFHSRRRRAASALS